MPRIVHDGVQRLIRGRIELAPAAANRRVFNGHLFLPNYGYLFCPVVAMISPHWRQAKLRAARRDGGGARTSECAEGFLRGQAVGLPIQ